MTEKKGNLVQPIPDTPENVARLIMQGPPKKDWDYLKRLKDRKRKTIKIIEAIHHLGKIVYKSQKLVLAFDLSTLPQHFTMLLDSGFPSGALQTAQGQRSPSEKVMASKGRTLTGSSSFRVAISTHSPSRNSKASSPFAIGSTSQRCPTPSRA